MSKNVVFHDLIAALYNSCVEAQRQVQARQLANVRQFFDDDNKPRYLDVALPSMNPTDSEDVTVTHRIPLLTLAATSGLRIKDMTVSFDVSIDSLQDLASAEKGADGVDLQQVLSVQVEPGVFSSKRRRRAKVVLTVEGGDPPEGVARLNSMLLKLI